MVDGLTLCESPTLTGTSDNHNKKLIILIALFKIKLLFSAAAD